MAVAIAVIKRAPATAFGRILAGSIIEFFWSQRLAEQVMPENFRVGEWLVLPQLNTISNGDAAKRIEPKIMEVLVYLASHPLEVISKEKIIQAIWGSRFVTDEVLTTAICELRKALGDEAKNPRFIQTIPKKGYRLIAPVFYEETPTPQIESLNPTEERELSNTGVAHFFSRKFRIRLAAVTLTA